MMSYVMLGLAMIGTVVVLIVLAMGLLWTLLALGSKADDWVDAILLDSEDVN